MRNIDIFQEVVIWQLGPLPLTKTMVTTAVISLALILGAALLRWAVLRRSSTTLAVVGELAVEWLDNLIKDIVGHSSPGLVVFSGTLLYFIAGCAIAGQLPDVRMPTASLATTSALAIVVFCAVPVAGVRSKGVRAYLRSYIRPNPLMLPLHVLSEVSRTFALSVRLFGNMMSGQLIVALLVALAGLFIPTPLMALDLLIGLLQAYIFSVLATVYVGAAIRIGEEL